MILRLRPCLQSRGATALAGANVIYAMENCGFSPEDIQRVVGELHYVFDMRGLEGGRAALSKQPLLASRHFVPK